MRALSRSLAFALCVIVAITPLVATGIPPLSTRVVSVAGDGQRGTEDSIVADVSGNGRYVVWQSDAADLTPGHAGTLKDIFVHDVETGETECVSVSNTGELGDDDSFHPRISFTGRYIVFVSSADNFAGLDNTYNNVFRYDRYTDMIEQITAGYDPANPVGANGFSYRPAISGDGKTIAFYSDASNLVEGDDNGYRDAFVWREGGRTQLVSVSSVEVAANHTSGDTGGYQRLDVSYDGRYVAFCSLATNLAPGDVGTPGTESHVFVRNTVAGTTERIDTSGAGVLGVGRAGAPSITPNGRWVSFGSQAENLTPGDSDGKDDVYVKDRWTGSVERVSVSGTEAEIEDSAGIYVNDISGAGDIVAFEVTGDDAAPLNDADYETDIWVRNRRTGETLNYSTSGWPQLNRADDTARRPALSSAGDVVVYDSAAYNLVTPDPYSYSDVYMSSLTGFGPYETEIEGSNRYKTAVAASEEAFPDGCDTVVVATGTNWPDALGGAALAGAVGGPLLLTKTSALPAEVRAEILRLGARKAYVLGGTAAVSDAVYDELDLITAGFTVERLYGSNRYATAGAIADEVIDVLGPAYDGGSFVATGLNFPDALAASSLAAFLGRPIYLVAPDEEPTLPREVRSTVILGGESVVTRTTQTLLGDKLGTVNVKRAGGVNRYETAAQVAEYGIMWGMHWQEVAISTGETFPDGLSGGATAGQRGSVMLLTKTSSLRSEPEAKLVDNADRINRIHFIGGDSAISPEVRTAVKDAID